MTETAPETTLFQVSATYTNSDTNEERYFDTVVEADSAPEVVEWATQTWGAQYVPFATKGAQGGVHMRLSLFRPAKVVAPDRVQPYAMTALLDEWWIY